LKRTLILGLSLIVSFISYSQIIADHTIVDKYDDIPQYYIDQVKKMWVSYAGESHSLGVRSGLLALEALDPKYAVNVRESGTPDPYTTVNLRFSRATWGDYSHATGWIYEYGEEDWFTSEQAISRTKAGITYSNHNGFDLSAIGFGWCWDTNIFYDFEFLKYINATLDYIAYCSDSIPTKVFFTTGTTDIYNGQTGYYKYLGYEQIRNSVKADPSRILFDYADILCYDDDGTPNTTTWDGHTYPWITATNGTPDEVAHISNAGALRLAKAMWWMLARMAGWNGITTDITENESTGTMNVVLDYNSDEIRINISDNWLNGQINLYNTYGSLVENKIIMSNLCTFSKSTLTTGIYIIIANKSNLIETKKILIVR